MVSSVTVESPPPLPFKTEEGIVAEQQAFLEALPLVHYLLLFGRETLAEICPSDVLSSPLGSSRDFRTLQSLYVQSHFIVFGSAQSVRVMLAATSIAEEDP